MCMKCEDYRRRAALLREVAEKMPEYKEALLEMATWVDNELDDYQDAAVEANFRDD